MLKLIKSKSLRCAACMVCVACILADSSDSTERKRCSGDGLGPLTFPTPVLALAILQVRGHRHGLQYQHSRAQQACIRQHASAARHTLTCYFFLWLLAPKVYNLSPCAVETEEFGLLHQSCPTVYKMVLEELSLGRGDSFLNVGSGSG